MKRRHLLRRTGALGVLALAGCVSEADPAASDGGATASSTETGGTPTDTPGTDPPSVVGTSVETTWTGCAQLDESVVRAERLESESAVEFGGLLVANNPCHEVVLEAVAHDPERDVLSVVVGTEPEGEACEECVGALGFEGRVTVDGGVPGRVLVARSDDLLATAGSAGDTDEADTPETSELLETDFEVTSARHGDDRDGRAEVRYDEAAGEVVVEGMVIGRNGCTTAELGDVSYDAESRTLDVDVETVVRRDDDEPDACTQALLEIQYEATFTFDGGLPESVTVTHDGEEILSGSRGTATAGTGDA